MLKLLFVYGVLGVLFIPAKSNQITVCVEDDRDLRVDCQIENQANKVNSYEFSWSDGAKEQLISTNVTGLSAEEKFKSKSYVELKPHGYRMTLSGFTDTLPHNTTYMCNISGQTARVNVEREKLETCSAESMFLKSSCTWIFWMLLYFYQTHN